MRFHDVDVPMIVLIASFSLALFLLTTLSIAASPHLERTVLLSENVRDMSELDAAQALERHEAVRRFILRGDTLQEATPEEIAHLHDVRRLIDILLAVALLAIAFGIGAMRKTSIGYRMIARRVSVTIMSTVILIAILTIMNGFESSFWDFHFIFFPQGNFAFPPDSFLITLYPITFFSQMASWIAALTIAIFALVYLISRESVRTT